MKELESILIVFNYWETVHRMNSSQFALNSTPSQSKFLKNTPRPDIGSDRRMTAALNFRQKRTRRKVASRRSCAHFYFDWESNPALTLSKITVHPRHIERWDLIFTNLVKQDPGRAGQNRFSRAGRNFTQPCTKNKSHICMVRNARGSCALARLEKP